MATVTVRYRVRQRWWLQCYLLALRAFTIATGFEPNMAKIEPWIRRGLYVAIEH